MSRTPKIRIQSSPADELNQTSSHQAPIDEHLSLAMDHRLFDSPPHSPLNALWGTSHPSSLIHLVPSIGLNVDLLPPPIAPSAPSIDVTGLHLSQFLIPPPAAAQNATGEAALLDVDMAHSRQAERSLALQLQDPEEASKALRRQIKRILMAGFRRANVEAAYESSLDTEAGDGSVFLLPTVAEAHRVAAAILLEAEQHNAPARAGRHEEALRCFRIGISTGPRGDGGAARPSGETYAQARRLQECGPTGEIRLTDEAYAKLPQDLRRQYGGVEEMPGKPHEPLTPGRRCFVAERALWIETDRSTGQEYPPITPNPDDPPEVSSVRTPPRCFVITPLSEDPRVKEVFRKLIVPACARAGYEAVRATQVAGARNEAIPGNLQDSPMVLAYLGSAALGWNPNVILEIGFRMATRRPLVILGDSHPDGRTPDYQTALPFQLVHHNIITITPRPSDCIEFVEKEIRHSEGRRDRTQSDTPLPIIELRFNHLEDVTVTDFNDAASALLGEGTLQLDGSAARLCEVLAQRCDPIALAAFHDEWTTILEKLGTWHRNRNGKLVRPIPRPRVPIVFKDWPIDPSSGKPEGYLPFVVRHALEGVYIQVRYLFVRVSAAMRLDEALGIYVCDV